MRGITIDKSGSNMKQHKKCSGMVDSNSLSPDFGSNMRVTWVEVVMELQTRRGAHAMRIAQQYINATNATAPVAPEDPGRVKRWHHDNNSAAINTSACAQNWKPHPHNAPRRPIIVHDHPPPPLPFMSSVQSSFASACRHVSSGEINLTPQQQLQLYALYKQATVGARGNITECSPQTPSDPPPPLHPTVAPPHLVQVKRPRPSHGRHWGV